MRFPQVFNVRGTGANQDAIAEWASEMRTHSVQDPVFWITGDTYTERPILVHSPEQTIGYEITGPTSYAAGTYVKDIELDPNASYGFRDYTIPGDEMIEIVESLSKAVRLYLNVRNERRFVGYVPDAVAQNIWFRLYESDEHRVVYPYKVTLLDGERLGLQLELRERHFRAR